MLEQQRFIVAAALAQPHGMIHRQLQRVGRLAQPIQILGGVAHAARLDEDTRKLIEHGRRIRACLKQPESAAVSVPEQIAILLALTAELFDPVLIDRMTDAEQAVREAAANIATDVAGRLETADSLSDEDREAIVEITRQALARFLPEPEAPEAAPNEEQE